MGFSIPSSARLPTPQELESQTGFQTYLTKTFAADEELLSELQDRTQGITFDTYGSFFEFLGDEGFTMPQAWTGRAGGSGLYADPSQYYKQIAPGSAKPASTSAKKSTSTKTYASRADELAAKQPEVYDRYMDLDPFEKAGGIDAELAEILSDPQAFSDYVAVQGLQDSFPQAVSGVVEVASIEEFYDALYGKYDASGSPLMTYEEQTGFKTTEGAYNHLKAYEENLYQKGLDHVDTLLSRGESGTSNLNIKLFAVYLEAYLENPQDTMAPFRALETVLSHWQNPIGSEGRNNVAVLTGFYHGIMKNLSRIQTNELRKLYLGEGGAKTPDQNPLLVGDLPKPLLNAISRIQKSVPMQMDGGFNKEVMAGTRANTLLGALSWIDSRASYAEGPRKLFEDARDLIVDAMEKSQVTLPPFAYNFYERTAHFPEGPERDKIYAEIGIKKEWVEQAYSDLKWRAAQGLLMKGAQGVYEAYHNPEARPADCSTQEWKIACDIACDELNTTVIDAALMGLRFVCIIGLAVVGGMAGGVGGAIVAAAVGGGAGAAWDVHDMTKNLERAQVNYYSDVDGTGLGSYRHVEVAQKDVNYAIACGVISTVASMVTAPVSVVGGEALTHMGASALKQVGLSGIKLAAAKVAINGTVATGNVALNSAVGVVDGTVMAVSDGRIMDVAHNQERMRLAGDEEGAKNYTPVTGIILSATLGGVIGGGFSAGGEALGGALKFLKPPRGTGRAGSGGTPGSRFDIKVDFGGDPNQPPKVSVLAPDGSGGVVEVPTRVVSLDETTGRVVLELDNGTRLEANINKDDPVHVEKARAKDADGDETLELDADDADNGDVTHLLEDDEAPTTRTRSRDDEEGLEELSLDEDELDLGSELIPESKGKPQPGYDPAQQLSDDVPTLAAARNQAFFRDTDYAAQLVIEGVCGNPPKSREALQDEIRKALGNRVLLSADKSKVPMRDGKPLPIDEWPQSVFDAVNERTINSMIDLTITARDAGLIDVPGGFTSNQFNDLLTILFVNNNPNLRVADTELTHVPMVVQGTIDTFAAIMTGKGFTTDAERAAAFKAKFVEALFHDAGKFDFNIKTATGYTIPKDSPLNKTGQDIVVPAGKSLGEVLAALGIPQNQIEKPFLIAILVHPDSQNVKRAVYELVQLGIITTAEADTIWLSIQKHGKVSSWTNDNALGGVKVASHVYGEEYSAVERAFVDNYRDIATQMKKGRTLARLEADPVYGPKIKKLRAQFLHFTDDEAALLLGDHVGQADVVKYMGILYLNEATGQYSVCQLLYGFDSHGRPIPGRMENSVFGVVETHSNELKLLDPEIGGVASQGLDKAKAWMEQGGLERTILDDPGLNALYRAWLGVNPEGSFVSWLDTIPVKNADGSPNSVYLQMRNLIEVAFYNHYKPDAATAQPSAFAFQPPESAVAKQARLAAATLDEVADVEHTIPSAPRPVAREATPERTPPRGMVVPKSFSSTSGHGVAQSQIREISSAGQLYAYVNAVFGRLKLAAKDGPIPDEVGMDAFESDGPVTVNDYVFICDLLTARLDAMVREVEESGAKMDPANIALITQRIDKLRLEAQNHGVSKPAVKAPIAKPVASPEPSPEVAARDLNAEHYKRINEALEILIHMLSTRVEDGTRITQSAREVYQAKLTAEARAIGILGEAGMDVKSLRKNLAVCREKLQKLHVVPDGTPLESPQVGPRTDKPSDSVAPVKSDRKPLPPE